MSSNTSILIHSLTDSMHQISLASNSSEVNEIVEKLLVSFVDSDIVTIFLFDSKKQTLYTEDKKVIQDMVNPKGFLGKAFLTKKPAFYNYIVSDKNYDATVDNPSGARIKSQMIVPIVNVDDLVGVVRISRSTSYTKQYNIQDMELVVSLNTFMAKIMGTLKEGLVARNDSRLHNILNNDEELEEVGNQISKNSNKVDSLEMNKSMLFISNTVHDIRTPANSLYGFLELIEEKIEDKRLKEFIENAKESAQFINTLTDSILTQAKYSHEVEISKPLIVNTIKYFSHIANTFSANMYDKGIHYLVHIDPSIPKEILIDGVKLKRVMINLIGNAFKFTPNNKRIDINIRFEKEKSSLKISVQDQGIGIEKDKQKKIFESFGQASDNTELNFGGTGLGLSISAKYVKDLGGDLKLKSAANKGSKFYFTIPIKVVNGERSFEKFKNINKNITILTDRDYGHNDRNIRDYLVELGMPKDRITISSKIPSNTTHLFCYQHKLSDTILKLPKTHNVELIVLEEELFSLSKSVSSDNDINIISENTYYGGLVHSAVFSKQMTKVLIVDDNKINIMLLKSILDTEYVEISSELDSLDALENMKDASLSACGYDVIYIDEHMPNMSGSELMHDFRSFEKENNLKPIYSISITGSPNLSENKKIFDMFVKKPFGKKQVRDSLAIANKKLL